MVADAERLIDNQVRAAEELDDKAEQMITLAVATLAGALTVALFIGQEPDITANWGFAGLYAVGLLLNLIGIVLFIDSYIGIRHPMEMYPAPDIRWLEKKRDDPGWNLESHLSSLISSYAAYSESNVSKMKQSADRRRHGLYLLMGAVSVYAVSILFIVAGTIG